MQLERIQGKNRSLMEEQVETIEKERISLEKQFYTQTKHVKEELEKQNIEVGRLRSQIEQHQRTGKFDSIILSNHVKRIIILTACKNLFMFCYRFDIFRA